jgi:transposase-like protein
LLEQESAAEIHEGKYHASVKELKKQLIIDAVEQTRGNYVDAAGILGVHPNYLHRLIRNLGLKARAFVPEIEPWVARAFVPKIESWVARAFVPGNQTLHDSSPHRAAISR